MLKSLMIASMALSLCRAAETGTASAAEPEATEKKSIVPGKYAGRYKKGQGDGLRKFIDEQCSAKNDKGELGDFEMTAFFNLCEQNGVAKDKVDHYRAVVDSKAQGANGRSRMTLGNMLRAAVRKNGGKVKDLSGEEHEVEVAAAPLAGAAAKAAEGELTGAAANAAGGNTEAGDELVTEEDGEDENTLGTDDE